MVEEGDKKRFGRVAPIERKQRTKRVKGTGLRLNRIPGGQMRILNSSGQAWSRRVDGGDGREGGRQLNV